MVHLPGKGRRTVPMLITGDVKAAMEMLVANRSDLGIPKANRYFFATKSENGYLDGWRVMREMAIAAGLEHPKRVTSTNLRKYVSTVAQVINSSNIF